MRTLLLASALFAGLFGPLAAGRDHAFCKTLWFFATPCAEIRTKLVQQIQAFSPLAGCDECQYAFVSATPRAIKTNHTSADGLQAETIVFSMSPIDLTDDCRVLALSTSLALTSLFDDGLNYCNLYNLLSASGLSSAPGFREMINERACMGYGQATCRA